jgi:hypothetical protein
VLFENYNDERYKSNKKNDRKYHDQTNDNSGCCCLKTTWRRVADVLFFIGTCTGAVISYFYVLDGLDTTTATETTLGYVSVGAACCWVVSALMNFGTVYVNEYSRVDSHSDGLQKFSTVTIAVTDGCDTAATKDDTGDQSFLSCGGWSPSAVNLDSMCGGGLFRHTVITTGVYDNNSFDHIETDTMQVSTINTIVTTKNDERNTTNNNEDFQLDNCMATDFFCGATK